MGQFYHGADTIQEDNELNRNKGLYYVKTPDKSLLCTKCKEVATIPYTVDWELYCKECKPSNAKFDSNIATVIDELEVYCPNWPNGCNYMNSKKNCKSHISSCPHNLFKCKKSEFGCKVLGTKTQMDAHICVVTTDKLLDKLIETITYQQQEIIHLKALIQLQDTHFVQGKEEITKLTNAIKEGCFNVGPQLENLGKTYFASSKYLAKQNLMMSAIDLGQSTLSDLDLVQMLTRLKYITISTIQLKFDIKTSAVVVNALVALITYPEKKIYTLELVGDGSKNELKSSSQLFEALSSGNVTILKLVKFSYPLMTEYITDLLIKNKSMKVQLLKCGFSVENARCKVIHQ